MTPQIMSKYPANLATNIQKMVLLLFSCQKGLSKISMQKPRLSLCPRLINGARRFIIFLGTFLIYFQFWTWFRSLSTKNGRFLFFGRVLGQNFIKMTPIRIEK